MHATEGERDPAFPDGPRGERAPKLRDALPDYLKRLFVVAYFTGVRLL